MRGWRLMLAMCALAGAGAATAYGRALIVGGANAPPGSWPSLVALVQPLPATPSQSQFCGGTLIDRQVVLTAGHCVDDGAGGVVSPGSFDVLVGVTDLSAPPSSYQRIGVSAINRHPFFDGTTLENDVAMLHLATPATLVPTVAVMDLAAPTDRGQWEAGRAAQIAGWGRLNAPTTPDSPQFTDALQQASIAVVADESCESPSSYGPDIFSRSVMVCAGRFGLGGVDACQGDSGGPLVVPSLNGANVLIGSTSFTSASNPCGDPNFPAVYARLDALRSFVYGPQGVSGVSPPGAPTGVTARSDPGGVSISWSAPSSNGGRAIAGYRITTAVAGMPPSSRDVPAGAQSVQTTGLSCDALSNFSVGAANAAGLGPLASTSLAILRPFNMTPPAVTGLGRVGSPLAASGGAWNVGTPTAFIWQRETTLGSGFFKTIAGATGPTYVPTSADVGSRIAATVTALNAGCAATALSNAIMARPRFRVISTRAPKVTLISVGVATVALRLQAEPRVRLAIRVVDPRGSLRAPIAGASRIDGAVPRVVTRRLTARLRTGSIHPVTVAFRGRPQGTLRTVRIVIVATNDRGERTETTVKARVRL